MVDSTRALRAGAAAALCAGCTTVTTNENPSVPSSPALPTLTTGRVGSLARPRVVTCADGITGKQATAANDVVAGPLSYPNALLLARPGSVKDFYGGGVGV